MSDSSLSAHSLLEAYLYLMIQPCAACGKGPYYAGDAIAVRTESAVAYVSLPATCAACAQSISPVFSMPRDRMRVDPMSSCINEGDRPSSIIDVGQWLVLSRMISEAAGRSEDKLQVRRFGIQAAQCIDEALKFFSAGEELPDSTAFFTGPSCERFRQHPEQFTRSRLLDLRAKLPMHSRYSA